VRGSAAASRGANSPARTWAAVMAVNARRRRRRRAPERRVRDVDAVVGIERDRDVRESGAAVADQRRDALHVCVGAGDRQCRGDVRAAERVDRAIRRGDVAEVVLRVDDQEMDRLLHGVSFAVRAASVAL